MNMALKRGLCALALIALAALTSGCDNDLLQIAPAESTVIVAVSPATIVLNPNVPDPPVDPETGELTGSATVTAQVLTDDGFPVEDVAVYFFTTGGRLGTQGPPGAPLTPVMTNPNGFAYDTITVIESSPSPITVTAQSGALTGTATVTRSFADCANTAPVADAGADDSVVGEDSGTTVELSASGSSDAETTERADLRFVWNCGNGSPPDIIDSATPWIVECVYDPPVSPATYPQIFTAKVTVTDDGLGPGDTRCVLSSSDEVKITITAPPSR